MQTPTRHTDRFGLVQGEEENVIDMDIDDDAEELFVDRALKFETIFAKSEEIQVSFYAHLPAEVKLLLRNAGMLCSLVLKRRV